MITIVPTLFSTSPNDNTAAGADQTAEPAKNFFPLLLALFPTGMTQSQLSQSPSASEPSPSTRLFQSQMATPSSSFVDSGEEKTAQEVIGAAAGKGDGTTNNTSSDPNLLLSLLLPFLSGQIPLLTNPMQTAQITTQEGQASSQSMQDVSPPSVLTQSRSTQGTMNEIADVDPGIGQAAVTGAPPFLGRAVQSQTVRASVVSPAHEQKSPLFAEQNVSTTDAEPTGVSPSNAEPTSVSTTDAELREIFFQPAVDTTLKDAPVERGIGEQGFTRSAKLAEQTLFIPASPKNGNQAGERPESRSWEALEKGGAQAREKEEGDALGQPTPLQATARPIFPTAPAGATAYVETKANTLAKEAPSLSLSQATARAIFPTAPAGATAYVETKANTLAKGTLNPYDSEERKESMAALRTYSGQAPISLQEPRAEALTYPAQIPTPGLELGANFEGMSQSRLLQKGQTDGLSAKERNRATETDILRTPLRPLPFPEQEVQTLSVAFTDPVPNVEVGTMVVVAPAANNGQTKGKEKPEAALGSARFLTQELLASPPTRQEAITADSATPTIVTAPTDQAHLSGEEEKTLKAPRLTLFRTQEGQDVPVTLQETTPTSAKPTVAVAELVLSESNPTASPSTERLIVEGSARGKGFPSVPNTQKLVTEAESLATKSTGVPSLSVSQPQPERPLEPRNNLESWQPVVNQVAERIVTNVREESREARLQLNPPELGKLDIQLVVEGSHIRAHIVAGSADIGALIQTHLPELKHALQEHRLDLDTVRVDIQNDGGGRDASSRNFQQDGRTSGRGSNLSSSSIVDEKESPPVLSPVHGRGRVSVWA